MGTESNNKKELSPRQQVLLALVAGIFVVGAAYLGGSLSRGTQQDVQKALFAHDAQSKRDDARSAARVMIADFDGAARNLCDIGNRQGWFVTFVPLRSGLSEGERQLIASEMNAAQWQAVALADSRLGTWDAVQRGVVGRAVDPKDWGFKTLIDRVQRARRKLEALAGYKPTAAAQFRQTCPEDDKWKRAPKEVCPVPSGGGPSADALFEHCIARQKRRDRRLRQLPKP